MPDDDRPFVFDRLSHHWLSQTVAPVLVALSLGLSSTAKAELVLTTPNPIFSTTDLAAIERNEVLHAAVTRDPWLVYRILRQLEASDRNRDLLPSRDPAGPRDFDSKHDPDLEQFQRVSPEAAHDLFLLLKKASSGGQAK